MSFAVQSANGTNSETDRKAIQDEVDQLSTEIDRVSETTKFNETYLLKGDSKTQTDANFYKSNYTIKEGTKLYLAGETNAQNNLTGDALKDAIASGKKIYTEEAGADKQDKNTTSTLAIKGKDYAFVTKLYDGNGKELSADEVKSGTYADGSTIGGFYTSNTGDTGVTAGTNIKLKDKTAAAAYTEAFKVNDALSFNLHVGADSSSDNKIKVDIASMSAAGIGVKGIQVNTEDDATAAIDRISEAISKVSSQRSSLGAVQNRLEHTINNLDNVSENTTSAESRIRDTDMAKEMVNYSKNNILAQAGQSMLAQANQSNQGVLSLLQ